MTSTYFLGANSAQGFYSLYGGFPPRSGFLHIIKGGPGTGKSGFMRAIGSEAERRGMDVEYVLCSGDPDSLDGVYIPALNEAWVDGTAPHALDPTIFGVTGDYVNLGRFCRTPFSPENQEAIRRITPAYKALYAEGYEHIAAAGKCEVRGGFDLAPLEKRLDMILRRCPADSAPYERCVFLRAISCRGLISLADTLAGYGETYEFTSSHGVGAPALELVRREAERRGLCRVLSMSLLHPERIDAVLLPAAGIAFFDGSYGTGSARHIRLDSMLTCSPRSGHAAEARAVASLRGKLLDLAVEKLSRAKALHDELELQYRPYMDFPALTDYTNAEISRIFGN